MGENKRGELFFYTVVFVPPAVLEALPTSPARLRLEGEINDIPFERGLQPSGGRRYLYILPEISA